MPLLKLTYIFFSRGVWRRVHDVSVWAASVTGHFNRDISVHKELMKFVKFVNVNEYLGRIIIYPYNTRQMKTQQFTLPKAR